ncbi:hypothetical protein GY45DRAFT_941745 [Cubamyces sp. BRFM 1775]|nr:hypothetical protein GY45DRAFT_941745 [Cubamyces sp. BRFM 1775]
MPILGTLPFRASRRSTSLPPDWEAAQILPDATLRLPPSPGLALHFRPLSLPPHLPLSALHNASLCNMRFFSAACRCLVARQDGRCCGRGLRWGCVSEGGLGIESLDITNQEELYLAAVVIDISFRLGQVAFHVRRGGLAAHFASELPQRHRPRSICPPGISPCISSLSPPLPSSAFPPNFLPPRMASATACPPPPSHTHTLTSILRKCLMQPPGRYIIFL